MKKTATWLLITLFTLFIPLAESVVLRPGNDAFFDENGELSDEAALTLLFFVLDFAQWNFPDEFYPFTNEVESLAQEGFNGVYRFWSGAETYVGLNFLDQNFYALGDAYGPDAVQIGPMANVLDLIDNQKLSEGFGECVILPKVTEGTELQFNNEVADPLDPLNTIVYPSTDKFISASETQVMVESSLSLTVGELTQEGLSTAVYLVDEAEGMLYNTGSMANISTMTTGFPDSNQSVNIEYDTPRFTSPECLKEGMTWFSSTILKQISTDNLDDELPPTITTELSPGFLALVAGIGGEITVEAGTFETVQIIEIFPDKINVVWTDLSTGVPVLKHGYDYHPEVVEDSVPGIGDIPYLGHLFRSNSNRLERRELVVLLKPTIVQDN